MLPAGGDCRLRLLNLDNTRIMEIGVEDAEAAIVAIDGIALPPVPLKAWRLGPAMRLDIVIRAPADGKTARLVDYFAPEPVPLARLTGRGALRRQTSFDPAPLHAGRMPEPDLQNAERLPFVFSATATADAVAEAEACRCAPRFALQRRRHLLGDQQAGLAGRRPQPHPGAARRA